MLARAVTHALVGLEPRRVEVEANVGRGLPGFAIVGLADRACAEAKHRVRSSFEAALLEWPDRKITVNLAPAALRKEGSGFDLAIALAVLAASRQIPAEALALHAAVGELALDGRVRPVGGTIAAAEAVWCGARKGGRETSGRPGGRIPATEWMRVTSSASSCSSGGRIPGRRRASIVFPVPGGPASRRLWPPAAAISSARRARSWPRTSARSGSGGSGA